MALLVAWGFGRAAAAQTGVSDDRVALPDGPGSIEGIGDNANVDPNMGLMTYRVPLEVPRGFAGVTPELALIYSSGAGDGIAGIGWSMQVPSIERLTLRGLPTYDADDEFAADGTEQLVRVSSSGGDAVYRARFESAFVRYTWREVGDAGYWVAEYPDGRVGYFGADATGTAVPEARLEGPDGRTFRYSLVEMVDVFGHRMRFGYEKVGAASYCASISYVFDADETPRHRIDLTYEGRPDPISDAKPGFEERTTQRLSGVAVSVNGEVIRRYVLTYEDAGDAGGLSRLVSVARFGRHGGRYPIELRFGYSRALGGVCSNGACGAPYVVDMGALPNGGAIHAGDATLIDINGDALPDVLDTSQPGQHRFILNRIDADGRSHFDDQVVVSQVGDQSGFRVSAPTVQVLDVNGDGFADIVNTFGGSVLCNFGTGDWSTEGCLFDEDLGFELTADQAGEADPRYTRFLDVNGDRRIDVVRTGAADQINVAINTGAGFEPLVGAEPIEAAFDETRLLLADVNGDGLLDPVQIQDVGSPQYRLNLGFARWGEWTSLAAPSVDASERDAIALEDLNDDGRDDFVLVTPGTSVRYALNLGDGFGPMVTLGPDDVADLPTRTITTAVLYADMNGNGSRDVVWIETSGGVRYLELFPVPPNLLSRIENGIGSVQEIHYDAAVAQRQRDDVAWSYPLAHPMNVVGRIDSWVTLTGDEDGVGLHEITEYRYRDGYYDGAEKAFRGFVRVDTRSPRDSDRDGQERGRTVLEYDVGAEDPYRHGRELTRATFSGEGDAERALEEERITYDDCPVAGLPDAERLFDVRHVCETARTTTRKEGVPEVAWATLRTTKHYDGYGNVVVDANLGIVHMGSPESPVACGACDRDPDAFGAACGDECLGDEAYVATEYVVPGADTGGRYLLHHPHTIRRYGREGGASTEETRYYDGPAFVGLAKGRLTLGNPTRVTARVREGSNETIDVSRSAYDENGQVIASVDPNGAADDDTAHFRAYQYDATGLRIVRTDIHLVDPEGAPYVLRREYSYDPAFDEVSEASALMVIEGGESLSARNATRYRYDEFGRRIAIIKPGDTDDAPTVELVWELADPASRIRVRARTVRGAPADLDIVRCHDGVGREYQRRTWIDGDRYQVSGFGELNGRGAPVRIYQPYVGQGAGCEVAAPTGVLHEDVLYDADFREIRRTYPDAALYGESSVRATRHLPLAVETFDEEDSDAMGLHAGTPTVVHLDGLGRTVGVARQLADGSAPLIRAEYDELGRLRSLFDAEGNEKQQTHDLLGRLVAIDDPSAGATTLVRDRAGNVVARTDARGVTVRSIFDGANRPTARWADDDRAATEVRFRYDFGGVCDRVDCTNAEGRMVEVSYPLPAFLLDRIGGGPRGVDSFGYDARGLPIFEARTLGGIEYRTRRERDDAGRIVGVVHPDGTRIDTEHDGASRVVAVPGLVDDVQHDARGLVEAIEYENGVVDRWSFDPRGRARSASTTDATGALLRDVQYARDRVGNVTSLIDHAEVPDGWPALDAQFAHDALYRVSSAVVSGDDETEAVGFGYDAIDNLVSATSSRGASSAWAMGTLAYDLDRPNALVRAGEVTFEYDGAGHVIGRGDLSLDWDHEGRLTVASRGDASLVQMAYGAGTSRVATVEGDAITLYVSPDFEVRDGIAVVYARLGRRRVARVTSDALAAAILGDVAPLGSADGAVTAADAWVVHASASGFVAADVAGAALPSTMLRSAARRLLAEAEDGPTTLHSDHLENLILATDARGLERGRRRYRFTSGEDRRAGFVDVYGFGGQEEIASLGWVRFEHRWLDPSVLRWMSPDPLFAAVGRLDPVLAGQMTDLYAYVGNEFATTTDPTGLMLRRSSRATKPPEHYGAGPATPTKDVTDAGFSVQKTLRFDGTWASHVRDIQHELAGSGRVGVVYVLYDGNHGDIPIKVGKSNLADMGRIAEYADSRGGGNMHMEMYFFKPESVHTTVEMYEHNLRMKMRREGHALPADNSATSDGPGFQNYMDETYGEADE